MHLMRTTTAALTAVALGGLALVAAPAASAHEVPGQALTLDVTGDGATSTVVSGSTWLRPGYLISTGSGSAGPTVLQTLHVRGHGDFDDARAPHSASAVYMGNGSADAFVTSTRWWLPSGGTIKIRNNGDSVHLFQMSKVADGTTNAAVQAEYDTILAGGTPTSDPANLAGAPTPSTGADALTPGQVASLTYHLPRGTYLIQCFIADSMTGMPHTFMGMHLIVHLG